MTKRKHDLLIILIIVQAVWGISFLNKDDFFSIIILPDTQYYSSRYPDIFYQQMEWIVENKGLLNIQYVVHVGDITDNNKEYAIGLGIRGVPTVKAFIGGNEVFTKSGLMRTEEILKVVNNM